MAARIETGGVGIHRYDTDGHISDTRIKNNLEKINKIVNRLKAKTSIDLDAIIASSKNLSMANKGTAGEDFARRIEESARMLARIIESLERVSENLKYSARVPFRPQDEVLKLAESAKSEYTNENLNISLSIDGILPACLKGYYEVMQKVTRLLMQNSSIKFGKFVSVNVRLMHAGDAQQHLKILITGSPNRNEQVIMGAAYDAIVSPAFTILSELISVYGGSLKMQLDAEKNHFYELSLPFSNCTEKETKEVHAPAAMQTQPAILLVDDIQVNQLIVSKVLAKSSAQLDWAVNGFEALEMMKNKKYDLILMDLEMPRMNGLETTARIREGEAGATPPDVPVIALTASNTIHVREQALVAGINAFIAKPVHREKLYEEISKYLAL